MGRAGRGIDGVQVDMTEKLSPGKIRGLRATATEAGRFNILALDHRGSLRKAMNPDSPDSVPYEDVVAFKQDVVRALAPHASAVLLDPIYGAAQVIISGVLPGHVGLLVALEKTGYAGDPTARRTELIPDWTVEKIKRMGASAVKVLLYYHPDSGELAEYQESIVRRVANDCRIYDIPFFLEPVSYSLDPNTPKSSAGFAAKRRRIVVETARRLSRLGPDVLKVEFPVDVTYEPDEAAWEDACRELSEVCAVPWALLSAGVDFEMFKRQVRVACEAGASGYLAGRAIWKESVGMPPDERVRFLQDTASRRLNELAAIADSLGRPWTDFHPELANPVPQGWYEHY